VVLHSRKGGSQDNLIVTYKSMTTAELQTLRGEAVQGVWKLCVADLEAADVGKLNRWALKLAVQEHISNE
jgi:subtilisin-like proprotein convertase family protein